MIYKNREKPESIRTMELLHKHNDLSGKDYSYYLNLKKGYEGEVQFDSIIEKLTCDCLVLNDLLFKENNTVFQIDSLIITGESILIYEVKNYEGQFIYREDSLKVVASNKPILNPMGQLNRAQTLFAGLMNRLGCEIPIQSFLIFVNQKFTLFEAPARNELILPTMVQDHFESLNHNSSIIKNGHKKLAKKLSSMHLLDNYYNNIPSYDFKIIEKGVYCSNCNRKILKLLPHKQLHICHFCGYRQRSEEIILESAKEYLELFPDKKMTISSMEEWCDFMFSKDKIRPVLQNNFLMSGKRRYAHYHL